MTSETTSFLYAALLAAVFWLAWLILKPFIPGLVWAAVLVAAFRPLHTRLSGWFGGRLWLASSVLTLLVAAFVVVPVVIAVVQVIQGAIQGYQWAQSNYAAEGFDLGLDQRWPWVGDAIERAKELIGLANVDFQAAGITAIKKIGNLVAAKGPGIIGGAFGAFFSFVVMIVTMVVFFNDGPKIAAAVAGILPLPREKAERVLNELGVMTRSVFFSVGLTAVVQACLAGGMLLILQVPNAFKLTALFFLAALIPGVGTALVWVPVAIWLAATGRPWACGIFALWCAGIVGTIDNVLRPLFARSGVKLPAMLLVVGMIGGLLGFGIVGLFLGPIILYLAKELTAVVREPA